jgi:hypothetical protein
MRRTAPKSKTREQVSARPGPSHRTAGAPASGATGSARQLERLDIGEIGLERVKLILAPRLQRGAAPLQLFLDPLDIIEAQAPPGGGSR